MPGLVASGTLCICAVRCVLTSLLITVRLCQCSVLISPIAVCVLCSTSVPVNIYWTLQVWGMKSICKDSNSVAVMFCVVWLLDRSHSDNVESCCRKTWSYYSRLWESWTLNSGVAKFFLAPGLSKYDGRPLTETMKFKKKPQKFMNFHLFDWVV